MASRTSNAGVEGSFTTMSDFYLLDYHQDKIMDTAKQCNWPTETIQLYSGDRGLQVLFAKLLLYIHGDRRAQGAPQHFLALNRDGKLQISSSPAPIAGLLFPTDLGKPDGPTLTAFGPWYQRCPIEVFVDDQLSALSETLQSPTSQASNLDGASPIQERLIVNHCDEIVQLCKESSQRPTS